MAAPSADTDSAARSNRMILSPSLPGVKVLGEEFIFSSMLPYCE
jgi:hypothetical protein